MIEILRESKPTPEWAKKVCLAEGRTNIFGDPNYRVWWGRTRLDWIGGLWTDYDASGNFLREIWDLRYAPKYEPLDRWHLERWVAPEIYEGPEKWHERTMEQDGGKFISALGPYPNRGEWEHSFCYKSPRDGSFVPITHENIAEAIRRIEYSRNIPDEIKRLGTYSAYDKQERDWSNFADDVLYGSEPPFHGAAHAGALSSAPSYQERKGL